MARQVASAEVGQRHRQHQRQVAAERVLCLERGEDARLGIERVEHRLYQDEIGAALGQRVDLFAIDRFQRVEIDRAIARVADIGRQRQRLVGRTHGAGDEAPSPVARTCGVAAFARDPRGGAVDLADEALGAIFGLADAVGVEGVGGDEVGAGAEIVVDHRGDHRGRGEIGHVAVAALVGGKAEAAREVAGIGVAALQFGAERPVLDQDPRRRRVEESLARRA